MIRARANASATREVSMVIQRRPHCSATNAVVPEPQVGSHTRSPGSVIMSTHRSRTRETVWTTYRFGSVLLAPLLVSSHTLAIGITGKSSRKRLYFSVEPVGMTRAAWRRRGNWLGPVSNNLRPIETAGPDTQLGSLRGRWEVRLSKRIFGHAVEQAFHRRTPLLRGAGRIPDRPLSIDTLRYQPRRAP
jgi:hypothetical protein